MTRVPKPVATLWPQDPAKQQRITGSILLFATALFAIGLAGGLGLRVPDLDAAHVAKQALSWLSGLVFLAAGGVIVVQSVKRLRAGVALLGAFLVILGLSLVGVSLGVPTILEPFVGLVQALVDFINLLLEIAGKVT